MVDVRTIYLSMKERIRKIAIGEQKTMTTKFKLAIPLLCAAMASPLIGGVSPPGVSLQYSMAVSGEASASTAAQKEATRLLKQVASRAGATVKHAETLQSFQLAKQVSFQSHAYELERAKGAINSMGRDLGKLQALRGEALPWQQVVIDQLDPMLTSLAANTTDAIEHLNENRDRLHLPEYRDAVENMSAYADQTRDLISVHVDYANALTKLERLNAESATASISGAGRVPGAASVANSVQLES